VTLSSPRWSGSSTPGRRGQAPSSSSRARPESEKNHAVARGRPARRDGVCGSVRPAESEEKLSYVALADLVIEAFDEVGSALPRVQQRALAGALVRDDAGDGSSARTTATAFVGVFAACAEKARSSSKSRCLRTTLWRVVGELDIIVAC
jgi:hypothetical protein